MDVIKQFEISKYSGGTEERASDSVVVEYSLTIYLNEKELVTLMCTPKSLDSLVAGVLYSEGVIETAGQIEDISVCEEDGTAHVTLIKERALFAESMDAKAAITKGSGGGKTIFDSSIEKPERIEKRNVIDPDKILALCRQFEKRSEIFIKTGGAHSCALCSQDEIILFEEDIGRHNALEKIFGKALLDDINPEDKMIFTSGRLSSEIIKKAAKRKVPVIVSRSAPTDAAVDIAKELNMTLIGFARGGRMNIYTRQV